MLVRIILGLGVTVVGLRDRRAAVSLAVQADPVGQAGPGAHPGEHPPQGRSRGHRGGRAAQAPAVDRSGPGPLLHHVGLHHPAADHRRGLRGPLPEDLPLPRDRPVGLGRLRGGLLRRHGPGRPGRLLHHPDQERPGPQGAPVPLLRLAHRRRLGRPGHDRRRHHHPAALPGRPGEHRRPPPVPLRLGRLRLPRHRQAAPPGRPGDQQRPGHHLPDPERGRHLGLHGLRLLLQAPAHLHGPHQRGLLPPAPGPGGPGQDARHGHGERRRGHRVRGGRGRPLLLEADAGLRHLHRVRALPVGLPGLEHREAPVAQAADHGAAGQHVRLGHPAAGGRGRT